MSSRAGFKVLAVAVAMGSATLLVGGAQAQDEATQQSAAQEQPGSAAAGARKSDLDQSEVRVVVTDSAARPVTTVRTRSIILPRILGTFR